MNCWEGADLCSLSKGDVLSQQMSSVDAGQTSAVETGSASQLHSGELPLRPPDLNKTYMILYARPAAFGSH